LPFTCEVMTDAYGAVPITRPLLGRLRLP
jgi:hypothetical protein